MNPLCSTDTDKGGSDAAGGADVDGCGRVRGERAVDGRGRARGLDVDQVLFALRILRWKYEWDGLNLWRSYCPVCLFRHLEIVEGASGVRLSCRYRCHPADILAAFSHLLEPCTVDDALSLAEDALEAAYVAVGGRRA